jgi:FHS family glucose/mannose:H+ symporter-like MFS transporter
VTDAAAARPPVIPPSGILIGLVVSGFLVALPGGLLPLWGYHIDSDYGTAANYFLALGAGMTAGSALALRLRARFPPERLLSGGCFASALALLLLSVAAPPAGFWYQSLALLLAGLAAGAVNSPVFELIAPAWEANPAGVTLRGGIFFGVGSILAAWLLSQCLDAASPARLLALTALVPGVAGVAFGRIPVSPAVPARLPAKLTTAEAVKDLRSVLAILFALLLFFQFANEWSIAGWLPVFLIDRLGLSPSAAVMLLALYWLALTVGRGVTARLLPLVRHGKLLGIAAFCALFGCTALLVAGTRFGIVVGILATGAGFSAIYPLAAERIATRFSYYHPGYFNGIFTFAMLGGMLAPFVLGHLAPFWGLEVVPLAAMLGSCAVFGLVLLIFLGRKVSGS